MCELIFQYIKKDHDIKIFIYSSLLDIVDGVSDEDIAGVIGHKVGHVFSRNWAEARTFDRCESIIWLTLMPFWIFWSFLVIHLLISMMPYLFLQRWFLDGKNMSTII